LTRGNFIAMDSSDSDIAVSKSSPKSPDKFKEASLVDGSTAKTQERNLYLSSSSDSEPDSASDNEAESTEHKQNLTNTDSNIITQPVDQISESSEKGAGLAAVSSKSQPDSLKSSEDESEQENSKGGEGQEIRADSVSQNTPKKSTTLSDLGLEASSSDESDADVGEKAIPTQAPQASEAVDPVANDALGLNSDDSDDSDTGKAPIQPAPDSGLSKSAQVAKLFGSDLDDSSDDEGARGASPALQKSGEDDDDLGLEQPSERKAAPPLDLKLPRLPRPSPTSDLMISKLPNIVGLKAVPFDETRHDQAAEQEEFQLTTNIMRWRFKRDRNGNLILDENGKPERETNTRLVKWSDGSLQLFVGDEVFDVVTQPLPNSYIFAHQKPEGGSTCLECQAIVPTRMVVRPTSLQSQAHRNLTLAVRDRNRRVAKLKRHNLAVNPEKLKEMRAKTTEDLIKKEARRQHDYKRKGGAPKMDAAYLEGGNYEGVSIKALKNATRKGPTFGARAESPASTLGDLSADSSMDDEDDWEKRREQQLLRAKMERQNKSTGDAKSDLSDSDEMEMGSTKKPAAPPAPASSDSDMAGGKQSISDEDSDTPKQQQNKKARKALISDSDSD